MGLWIRIILAAVGTFTALMLLLLLCISLGSGLTYLVLER